MKQLISREVDLEKIKRNELKVSKTDNATKKMRSIENVQQPPKLTTPNHLVRLQPKSFREVSLVSDPLKIPFDEYLNEIIKMLNRARSLLNRRVIMKVALNVIP